MNQSQSNSQNFVIHIHLLQIRYQIKANIPEHMTKHAWLFFNLLFLKKSSFFPGEAKVFWASLLTKWVAYNDSSC